MSDVRLAKIGIQIEEAIERLNCDGLQDQELFDLYEGVAIAILDSQHQDFAPGELEQYLIDYLNQIRQRHIGTD